MIMRQTCDCTYSPMNGQCGHVPNSLPAQLFKNKKIKRQRWTHDYSSSFENGRMETILSESWPQWTGRRCATAHRPQRTRLLQSAQTEWFSIVTRCGAHEAPTLHSCVLCAFLASSGSHGTFLVLSRFSCLMTHTHTHGITVTFIAPIAGAAELSLKHTPNARDFYHLHPLSTLMKSNNVSHRQ